jgi:transposase
MQPTQHDDCMPREVVLAVSFELAGASWKIALHDGKRDKPAIYTVNEQAPAPRLLHAVAVIEAVRQKWSVPEQALVIVVIFERRRNTGWREYEDSVSRGSNGMDALFQSSRNVRD